MNLTTSKQSHRREARRRLRRRGVSIQWRLLAYLSIFVVFILLVLWVFQVQMLNRFYENIKQQEMKKIADSLVAVLGDDEATERAVYAGAVDYSTCICVYRIEGPLARQVASADVSGDCIIHHVTGDHLAALYNYAKNNDGLYTGKVQFRSGGMVWLDEDGHPYTDTAHGNGGIFGEKIPDGSLQNGDISALYIQTLTGADDKEYVIMLDAGLTPMSATVSTLKTQFWWIAVTLLLGALLLAYLMSRRISRPLIRMNEAARSLAEGRYDVQFLGQGYRETRELAATLNYAAAELSKTDTLQKELIANVSHDLRTPLTMIRGYGEVMRDLPGENTPENVQVIIDETNRLSELVNDMLDLSRLQAGTRTPEFYVFDLTDTVRSVMLRYEKLTGHDGYTVTFSADENVSIYADRTMILQVVYNLINNAINYCGEDRRVDVLQRVTNGRVRICVRDFGSGIEPEQLPLIWDRYYKVDRVHRRAMIGTGLGLSISKGVLELHGALYGVNSTPGHGSEFWFELPVASADEKTNDDVQGE